MRPHQADDIVALLAGEKTASQLAHAHGVTVAQVEDWKACYLAGLRAATRRRTRVPRTLLLGAAAAAGLAATAAAAQAACDAWPGLPAPMTTFCPGSPAVADDVNRNFAQLATWLQAKVGPVSESRIRTTEVVASGFLQGAALRVPGAQGAPVLLEVSGSQGRVDVRGEVRAQGDATLTGRVDVDGLLTLRQDPLTQERELPGTWTGTGAYEGMVQCSRGQYVCGANLKEDPNIGTVGLKLLCCTLGR